MKKGRTAKIFFCDSDGLYIPQIKSLGVRAPRPRDFFLLSEVTTTKIGLFKMVKMQKRARGAPKRAPEHGPKNVGYVSSSKKNIGLIS